MQVAKEPKDEKDWKITISNPFLWFLASFIMKNNQHPAFFFHK